MLELLMTKMQAEVLQMSKALADRVFVIDPFMKRSRKCQRVLEAAMLPDEETYRDLQAKTKQSITTTFFSQGLIVLWAGYRPRA